MNAQCIIPLALLCTLISPLSSVSCSAQSGSAAQSLSAAKLEFDVASVKPSASLDMTQLAADLRAGKTPRIGVRINASRAEYLYISLRQLVALAYQVKAYQVTGPDWMGSEYFDVEATMPEGASKDDAPTMLKSLLEERFKLAAHRTTEEHKVLALVVGKNGPNVKESVTKPEPIDENAPLKPGEMKMDTENGQVRMMQNKDGSTTVNMGTQGMLTYKFDAQDQAVHMESSYVTFAGFADTLTSILKSFGGEQVVDMTGLKGTYELALNISITDLMAMVRSQGMGLPPAANAGAGAGPAAAASDPGIGTSLYRSIDKMGLKLEERKAPVKQLIVDHVEKMPTEN